MKFFRPLTDEEQRKDSLLVRAEFIAIRLKHEFTMEQMAEITGYSVTQYSRIENGEREITFDDISKIHRAIIKYDDSFKTPLQRTLAKFNRRVNRVFILLELLIAKVLPFTERIFHVISFRAILVWSILIYLFSSINIFYSLGAVLGRAARIIENIIGL
ncbi:MAG: helix-turn-helix domain-containing protein [Daejeonella sp.]